ncbi:hypothetical protein EDD21DRAFT_408854 [Dissophora ornata]|nr:hypothetical protein EDD21DRAFT_408854 [Dissophora ornata]
MAVHKPLVQDFAGGDHVDGAPAQEQTGQGSWSYLKARLLEMYKSNLIERNRHRKEKEMERQIRREQRRLEWKEMERAQAAAGRESMDIDDGGNDPNGGADEQTKRSERRHHRHHRHRSPRLEKEGDESGEMNEGVGEEGDEETARRIKEQQRKERWLRKEQKMQRRQEKEERIQVPLLIVRIPGYAGQSSDSEASISVMRSVRKEQKLKKKYVLLRCSPAI